MFHIDVVRPVIFKAFEKQGWAGGVDPMPLVIRFLGCRSGATAIEYGLIAGLIGVVLITVLANDGLKLRGTFNKIANNL